MTRYEPSLSSDRAGPGIPFQGDEMTSLDILREQLLALIDGYGRGCAGPNVLVTFGTWRSGACGME